VKVVLRQVRVALHRVRVQVVLKAVPLAQNLVARVRVHHQNPLVGVQVRLQVVALNLVALRVQALNPVVVPNRVVPRVSVHPLVRNLRVVALRRVPLQVRAQVVVRKAVLL